VPPYWFTVRRETGHAFLRHRIKKYPDSPVHTLSDSLRIYFFPLWPRPHVIGFVADIFFSTLESGFIFFSGFAVEFAGYVWTVAVSGKKKLRIRKYPDRCGRGLSELNVTAFSNVWFLCYSAGFLLCLSALCTYISV